MASNYQITIKNSQDEIAAIIADLTRQITHLDKEIAEKDQTRQALLKTRAVVRDYGRLLAMEIGLASQANR